jgi:hypothetical protein
MSSLPATVQRVVALAEAHPIRLSLTGATSGLFAWFVAHAEGIKLTFQLIGGGLGAILAAISLLLALPRLFRFIRAWRRRGFTKADLE